MIAKLLTEKYAENLHGVLNCYDRIVISGNLHPLCYAQGMTRFLYTHQIRIFDYKHLVLPLQDIIRTNAEAIAKESGLNIEFIRKAKGFRKEDRVQKIIHSRGGHPGLVHIFSAMESCAAYQPWHDKRTGKTFVRRTQGKCLHYYFYFIDEDLGLCYLRVPTWCPFRLQFYYNGHNWLASQLRHQGIAYEQHDNAFLHIADFEAANQLASQLSIEFLHAKLGMVQVRLTNWPTGHFCVRIGLSKTNSPGEDLWAQEEMISQARCEHKSPLLFCPLTDCTGRHPVWQGNMPSRERRCTPLPRGENRRCWQGWNPGPTVQCWRRERFTWIGAEWYAARWF